MKILFIGSVVNDKLFNSLVDNSKKNKPSIAGQRFERLIVEGLKEEGDIELLSYLPTPTFPTSKKIFSKVKDTLYKDIKLVHVPLINITLVKQIIIMLFTFLYTFYWCIKNRKTKKNILLSLVYLPTAIPTLLVSKVFNVPVSVVVPDVSSYRFDYISHKSIMKRMYLKVIKKVSQFFDSKFDGYIFLTEAMDDLMNKKNKPYIVIEGMIENDNNFKKKQQIKEEHIKYIMYAGSLREKYGILTLLEAFMGIDKSFVELWIFGTGDQEEKIKKMIKNNNRIKFLGLKPQKEVFEYEKRALLLINPRPSKEKFTKYSFPSKTLEYMSSGTPVLTTKLPGIPMEYNDYLYFFDDESREGIKRKLNEVLKKDVSVLEEFGESAKEFVYLNKNHIIQTKKIHSFLKDLLQDNKN